MKNIVFLYFVIVCSAGCSTGGIKLAPDSWKILSSTNPETGDVKTELTKSGAIGFTCYSSRKSIYLGFGGEITSVPSNAVAVVITVDDGQAQEFSGYTGRESTKSGYVELYVAKARALLNEVSEGKEIVVKVTINGKNSKYTENLESADEFVDEFIDICL